MDFEYHFDKIDTSSKVLETRGYFWLTKFILNEIKLDFDTRLTNRLKLSSSILSEVLKEVEILIEASVLTNSNRLHKKSLGSLLYWLLDFLDARQVELSQLHKFFESLVSKLIYQLKIYPTVFVCAYYNDPRKTTIYASIRSARRQSSRLSHLLEFDTILQRAELQSGIIDL